MKDMFQELAPIFSWLSRIVSTRCTGGSLSQVEALSCTVRNICVPHPRGENAPAQFSGYLPP